MNKLEQRLRDGLHTAADNLPDTAPPTTLQQPGPATSRWNGPAIALSAAALVLVVFGGATLLIPSSTGELTTPPTIPFEQPAPWYLPDTFASEFQQELMSDAIVTYDELQQAMNAWVECLENQGFTNVAGKVGRSGESEVSIAWGRSQPSGEDQVRWREAVDSCEQQYFAQVNTFYGLTHPQVWEDPYTEQVSTEIVECMSEQGVNIDTVPLGLYAWQEALAPLGIDAERAFSQCESNIVSSS